MNIGTDLEGKGVVVTGAASGVGRATARALARAGCYVYAIDINGDGLKTLVDDFDDPRHLTSEQFDLRRISEFGDLLARARAKTGDIWALVHVAAVLRRQLLRDVTEKDWDFQHDINLKATFFLNRATDDLLVEQGLGGRIVNFTSTDASLSSSSRSNRSSGDMKVASPRESTSDCDVYSASKTGIVSVTRSFARAYASHGILVNAILPALVDTPMQRANSEETLRAAVDTSPMARLSSPEEIAAVVRFLLTTEASYINGAVIPVNGGFSAY